ncbi:NADP-dependent alkenal double bond reductase P2 [Acorus calamus]|uniref:NADP-dependent alkenal double bond reductase P2 n=1 Tax=Acorus calamus TaxID=4465 RepID=A0AAV9EXK9_ACOCL|nr:NADP-dependent alkenal double bond reductase P2 [Acorus calamus]
MAEVSNKRILFKDYITGAPKETDMVPTVGTIKLKVPEGSKGVLVKNLYLSCDPYMRNLMNQPIEGQESYILPFFPGHVVTGFGVSKVVDSDHPNFKEGEYVWGITGWEEYSLVPSTDALFKIPFTDVPLSYYTGVLGMPGLTAYAGFHEICTPKKGEYVYVPPLQARWDNLWDSTQS